MRSGIFDADTGALMVMEVFRSSRIMAPILSTEKRTSENMVSVKNLSGEGLPGLKG